MRFGEPWESKREKMRLMPDGAWRRWFAWYPIRIRKDLTWVWWEYVEYTQPMRYNLPEYRHTNS